MIEPLECPDGFSTVQRTKINEVIAEVNRLSALVDARASTSTKYEAEESKEPTVVEFESKVVRDMGMHPELSPTGGEYMYPIVGKKVRVRIEVME